MATEAKKQHNQYDPDAIDEFHEQYAAVMKLAETKGIAMSVVESQLRDTLAAIEWRRKTILGIC